jgi:hypothetical protein
MSRPISRCLALLFLIGPGAALAPGSAQAQTVSGAPGSPDLLSDPFTFYYAYYLPNQQLQAMRPRPIDEINQAVQNRQYYAQTQRRSLYNPISPYADNGGEYDPLRPYSQQQGRERVARPHRFSHNPHNADGSGPSLYYNRAVQYFPDLRAGRGPNANVARVGRGRRGGMGMGGMGTGGMGGGMGMGGLGGFG